MSSSTTPTTSQIYGVNSESSEVAQINTNANHTEKTLAVAPSRGHDEPTSNISPPNQQLQSPNDTSSSTPLSSEQQPPPPSVSTYLGRNSEQAERLQSIEKFIKNMDDESEGDITSYTQEGVDTPFVVEELSVCESDTSIESSRGVNNKRKKKSKKKSSSKAQKKRQGPKEQQSIRVVLLNLVFVLSVVPNVFIVLLLGCALTAQPNFGKLHTTKGVTYQHS